MPVLPTISVSVTFLPPPSPVPDAVWLPPLLQPVKAAINKAAHDVSETNFTVVLVIPLITLLNKMVNRC
ncbi:hypothetical protein LJK87_20240 [Paenibacillus sp. P25]|nr:hypothetical protein LJK87_20240 [Paenibacillus sp. P25]